MRHLALATLIAASGCGQPGHPDDLLPLGAPATVQGSWDHRGDVLIFMDGIAHGNAFFHQGRGIVALTTWEGPSCDAPGGDWLQGQPGHLLEVPIDGEGGIERALLQACEGSAGDWSCNGIDSPEVRVHVDGTVALGEPLSGTVAVLDGVGKVQAEIAFEVMYCGEE